MRLNTIQKRIILSAYGLRLQPKSYISICRKFTAFIQSKFHESYWKQYQTIL